MNEMDPLMQDGAAGPLPTPPAPNVHGGLSVRNATSADLAFIDRLQKQAKNAVGWMPTAQLEGHIAQGHVIVGVDGRQLPVGYCIGVDRYFKREDVGIIYQMNIAPGSRRGYVGAALLQAMFERSAYGVKLFCCWCAQDLEANRFWEAMGFVPLAFRAGSRRRRKSEGGRGKAPAPGSDPGSSPSPPSAFRDPPSAFRDPPSAFRDPPSAFPQARIHVFWQKRIRAGDVSTPWWFPSQTGSGALREDRIVLPIPPGVHWSDAKPAVLPGVAGVLDAMAAEREAAERDAVKALPGRGRKKAEGGTRKGEDPRKGAASAGGGGEASVGRGGLHFASPSPTANGSEGAGAPRSAGARREAKRAARKQVAQKNHPTLVAMARELRDRWLEQVAAQPELLEAADSGRYLIERTVKPTVARVEAAPTRRLVDSHRLDAA